MIFFLSKTFFTTQTIQLRSFFAASGQQILRQSYKHDLRKATNLAVEPSSGKMWHVH